MRQRTALGDVLSAVALGGALLLSWSAPAQNTTTTTSTETHTTITPQLATLRYDDYETRVTARMGAGPVLYDQTFPLRFSDPSVQAAVAAATAALQGAGAVTIQGPTLISSQTTYLGTTSTFQDTLIRSTQRVFTTTFTGPLCIGVGNRDVGPSVPCPPVVVRRVPVRGSRSLLRHALSHPSRGHKRRHDDAHRVLRESPDHRDRHVPDPGALRPGRGSRTARRGAGARQPEGWPPSAASSPPRR